MKTHFDLCLLCLHIARAYQFPFSFLSLRRTLKVIKKKNWKVWTIPVTRGKTCPVSRIKVLWIALNVHPPLPPRKTLSQKFQRIPIRKWTLRAIKAILMLDDDHWHWHVQKTGLGNNIGYRNLSRHTGKLWERESIFWYSGNLKYLVHWLSSKLTLKP